MCLFLKLILCFGFLVVSKCQDWTYANERCRTPDGAFGYCIPVRQCRPMLQALQSVRRPLSRSLSLLFDRYSCGQNAQAAQVCCPNGPINLQSVYSNRPSPDLSHNNLVNQDDKSRCQTPHGVFGNCIPVRQCRPMVQALYAVGRPVPQTITQEVNRYVCSYNNQVVHICCPNGPIVLQTPPDVSHHRNIRLLPRDCGYLDTANDRIRNGQNANLNEFPWMALLSYRTRRGPQFKCGATIINNRYILTAAHCIKDTENPLLGVRVGEYNIATRNDCQKQLDGTTKCTAGVQDLAIEELIPHPQFNATIISNDIGLIRVTPMDLNRENTRPVCLPLAELKDEKLTNVIVTGWGVTNVWTGESSQILQKVSLQIIDLETCKTAYSNQSRAHITYKQVCAGGRNNQDSCPGDSGGPLHTATYYDEAARYIQQGIVSFGPRECGLEGFPGVYTRVAYYMDWILDNIKP